MMGNFRAGSSIDQLKQMMGGEGCSSLLTYFLLLPQLEFKKRKRGKEMKKIYGGVESADLEHWRERETEAEVSSVKRRNIWHADPGIRRIWVRYL